MRIDRRHRTAFRSEQIRRIETAGRKLQHRDDLFPCDVEPFHDLVDGSPGFKVLENGGNRHAGVLKHPCTAYLAGDALHGGTLGPVESCHVLYPSVSFYHGSATASRAGSGPGVQVRVLLSDANPGRRGFAASRDDCLTVRSGRRPTLSRELQDGHELLQSEFEDLDNFQKRLAVGSALQDLSQRHPSSADSPNVASGSRTGTSLVSLAGMLAYLT